MANNKSGYALIPFPIIEAATHGDAEAINIVLRHYSGYIMSLSTRASVDERGAVHMTIDPEICRRLETKLITRILKFKII